MKRVLITGANGFIGQHCFSPLLSKEYEIHAISSKVQEKQRSITWHCIDLLALKNINALMERVQPTHLLHLAWCTTPGKYWTSPDNFRWVQSSLSLLRSFEKNGGQRVVMAGTCAEYDAGGLPCKEGIALHTPASLYGACKHALQVMLTSFSRQTRLSSAWGRIFHVYGPYEPPSRLVASVILALLQGKPALCTHGNQIRDLLFVEDVADAFVALLDADLGGPVNIASGNAIPLKNVIYKIAEKLKRPDLVKLGARPCLETDPLILSADVSRLVEETGWSSRFDLDEGLDRSITWWKKYLLREKNGS